MCVRTLALTVILVVMTAACASRGAVPRPFPGAAIPPADTTPTDRAEAPVGESEGVPVPPTAPLDAMTLPAVIQTALDFLGVPYRLGGSDPSGFDCSGLMQWVFARHGTTLPREVRDQYRVGREIDLDDVKPGDLIFFETVSRGASHVGMVLGKGRFIHAPSSRGVVRVEPYTANYWIRRFVGVRRVMDAGTPTAATAFPGAVRVTR
jgi:cell wall-associated NlpC family hydrolase